MSLEDAKARGYAPCSVRAAGLGVRQMLPEASTLGRTA